MGEVYRARDTKLNRDVALKVLPEAFARDPERMARFQREAQVLASLNHPNIASIYGLEESGGVRALVMELVEGKSLKQRIVGAGLPTAPGQVVPASATAGRPPQGVALQTDEVLNLAIQIADGLDAAHQKGVVHRDIKPANILVTPRGQVKILDFGLAKLTNPPTLSPRPLGGEGAPSIGAGEGVSPQDTPTASLDLDALTSPGAALGTVAYMSPEQARGEDTDARTDLFSFGAVLYEMATGRMAFSGNTTAVIFDAILHHAPKAPSHLNPDLPAELERIINKALEKEKEVRYQVAAEMRADLKRLKRDTDSGRQPARATAPYRTVEGTAGQAPPLSKGKPWRVVVLMGVVGIIVAVLGYVLLRPAAQPKVSRYRQVTSDGRYKIGFHGSSVVTDGTRLYFSETVGSTSRLAQASVNGGETALLPTELTNTSVADLSPDRNEILLWSFVGAEAEGPLWAYSILGGSSRRLGDAHVHDAGWSPDGQKMVYASGRSLYVAGAGGDTPRKLLTAEGVPSGTRWSPDGQRIRFSVYNPGTADVRTFSGSLWEVSSSGADPHPLLAGWNNPPAECCGNWTPDGKYFVFGSNREKRNDIWVMRERSGLRNGQPVRLTAGPVEFSAPVPSPNAKQVFVVGTQLRVELLRYDLTSRQFVPYLPGISATDLSPSADGHWITYVTYPQGTLWRSKVDGSDRLQLSFPPMEVSLPRWSPNDTRIAFTGQMLGQPSRIYLVSRDGGDLQQVTSEERHEADPNWSPDGKSLVFGRLPFLERGAYGPTAIHLVDIESRRISTLPGSEGLFSPHWSPDGRYIEAVSNDGQQMMLFDFQGNKWTEVVKMQVEYPNWSRDGKHVYFCNSRDHGVYRVRVNDRKVEKVTGLENLGGTTSVFVNWCGLAADDSPLVQRDNTTEEIYALDVELP